MISIFNTKLQKSNEGITPLNRPKDYRNAERRKEKIEKKNNWANKDGSLAPIIVPATPGGVQDARRMTAICAWRTSPNSVTNLM